MGDDLRAAIALTDDEIAELRKLAVAVLADRLYVLGSNEWANAELVARWNATVTPTLILQLTRAAAERAASAEVERDNLENVLIRNGFVKCDIPECNCGSWHARYGLRERWEEIKDDLAEAGHPLCNENGNTARKALAGLVAERDQLRAAAASAELDAARWLNLLIGYRKMVNAVAPHFDKPITDDNVVLWLNLNNAGQTVDATIDAARGAP